MFNQNKRDYYSVNADVSLQPIHQRNLSGSPTNADGTFAADPSQIMPYDGQDQTAVMEGGSMLQQSQIFQQQPMEPPRYEDVYYPRTDKRMIHGNQYTYEGNEFKNRTFQGNAVEESVNTIIQNQEMGPTGEFSYTLSSAKVANLKGLRPSIITKNYSNLYNDAIVQSKFHERQKFGSFESNGREYRHALHSQHQDNMIYNQQQQQPPQYLEDVKEQAQQEEADQQVKEIQKQKEEEAEVPQKNVASTASAKEVVKGEVNELFEMRSEYLYPSLSQVPGGFNDKKATKNNTQEAIEKELTSIKAQTFPVEKVVKINTLKSGRRNSSFATKRPTQNKDQDFDDDKPLSKSSLKEGDFTLQSFSIQIFKDKPENGVYPLIQEFNLKFSSIQKLFYLSKEQVLKAILPSITFDSTDFKAGKEGAISFQTSQMLRILSDLETPQFRQIYTSVTGSLCQFLGKEKKKGDFLRVLVTTPYFQMEKDNKRVIKYLSGDDFNALMASNLENWTDYVKMQFQEGLGKEYEQLKDKESYKPGHSFYDQAIQVSKTQPIFLPRGTDLISNTKVESPLSILNYGKENLGSQACLVQNSRLEGRYYVRLEGYVVMLQDDERNILASLLLDLEQSQKVFFKMSLKRIDFLQAIAKEVKIDYEQMTDSWTMELDTEQFQKDFQENKFNTWELEKDSEFSFEQKLKIGGKSYTLSLKPPSIYHHKFLTQKDLQKDPKLVGSTQSEEEIQVSQDLFKSMVALSFGNWQEQCVKHIAGKAGRVSVIQSGQSSRQGSVAQL